MFTEVELKYSVKGFTEVRKKLLLAGAELICEATKEKNAVFDMPDGSLAESSTLLRLREFGDAVILTVKEPGVSGAMKIRREHETLLSISFDEMEQMLRVLSYIPVFHYEKTREIWSLNSAHICLDSLFFGKFVEIEADTQLLVRTASLALGFNPAQGLNKSYKQLQILSSSS